MASSYQSRLRNCRISARKARLVVDLVRGRAVQEALDILHLTNKKAAPILHKMIRAAIASAVAKETVDVDRLIVAEAFVDEGPTMKRFLPRAQGRATPLKKRTAHITVKLQEWL